VFWGKSCVCRGFERGSTTFSEINTTLHNDFYKNRQINGELKEIDAIVKKLIA